MARRRKPLGRFVVSPEDAALLTDPTFWQSVNKVGIRERQYLSGSVERVYTLKSVDGRSLKLFDHFPANKVLATLGTPVHDEIAAAIKMVHKAGTSEAMLRVASKIDQIEAGLSDLLPAAQQKANASYTKALARRNAGLKARERKWFFHHLRALAARGVIEREELRDMWDLGIAEGVHES